MPKYQNYNAVEFENLREMLRAGAEKYPHKAAVMQKINGTWRGVSYRHLLSNVNALGTELLARGLGGKNVLLLGRNGAHWVTAYLAVLCGVGTVIPIDSTSDEKEIARIAAFSDAAAIIHDPIPHIDFSQISTDVQRFSFDSLPKLIASGNNRLALGDRSYTDAQIDPNAVASVLFTPGSAGAHKGVMLSHRNLCFNVAETCRMVYLDANDTFLSLLPLHHAYESTCGLLCPLSRGATVAYPEHLGDMSESMNEIHPSVILTVPVLLESMYRKILLNVQRNGIEKRVSDLIKTTNTIPSQSLRLSTKKSVFSAIHASFGGQMRLILTIGDAINPAVLAGFWDLGIPALQGYGLTECAPLVAINRDTYYHLPAAGLSTPNILVDIHGMQDNGVGEIRVKGDNVMLGYFKMPDATAAVLRDGWLYTGDLGRLDKNGFLHVTGSKKNVITLAGGASVSPEEIEKILIRNPYVKEVILRGEPCPSEGVCRLVAHVYPNLSRLKLDFGEHYTDERLNTEISRAIADANAQLPPLKQIHSFSLRATPFKKSLSGRILRGVFRGETS